MIEPEQVPGRMGLLVTLFLVVISIFDNLTSNSPNSNGFNAASAWIFSCLIFVFGTLVGYAGLLFKIKKTSRVSEFRYNLKVFLPPFKEQQQISNYLDHKTQQIDSLIESLK